MRGAALILSTVLPFWAVAQSAITGRVVDAGTQSPLGYATVLFGGTSAGTTTQADARCQVPAGSGVDSLRISYVGYRTKSVPIAAARPGGPFGIERTAYEMAEFPVNADDGPY